MEHLRFSAGMTGVDKAFIIIMNEELEEIGKIELLVTDISVCEKTLEQVDIHLSFTKQNGMSHAIYNGIAQFD